MEKEYKFLCTVTEIARGYVTAKNIDEAKQKIKENEYDDIVDTYDMSVQNVIEIEEVK